VESLFGGVVGIISGQLLGYRVDYEYEARGVYLLWWCGRPAGRCVGAREPLTMRQAASLSPGGPRAGAVAAGAAAEQRSHLEVGPADAISGVLDKPNMHWQGCPGAVRSQPVGAGVARPLLGG